VAACSFLTFLDAFPVQAGVQLSTGDCQGLRVLQLAFVQEYGVFASMLLAGSPADHGSQKET
jgi:hypothetical protein